MSKKEKVEKHAHLVDKWVLTESINVGGVVASKPRLVTKVSGDRVYISRRIPAGLNRQSTELEEDSFVSSRKVLYVFDTEEIAIEAANQCYTLWSSWFFNQKQNMINESQRILKELSNG